MHLLFNMSAAFTHLTAYNKWWYGLKQMLVMPGRKCVSTNTRHRRGIQV